MGLNAGDCAVGMPFSRHFDVQLKWKELRKPKKVGPGRANINSRNGTTLARRQMPSRIDRNNNRQHVQVQMREQGVRQRPLGAGSAFGGQKGCWVEQPGQVDPPPPGARG